MGKESKLPYPSLPDTYDPLKSGSIDGTDTEPHDRGVVRAMEAVYHPSNKLKSDPKLTLFVGGLNPKTDDKTLYEIFSEYGSVVRCKVVRDIVTGFSKRYAFIEFEDKRSLNKAYYEAHKMHIQNYEVLVELEASRNLPGWVPRRLGGGFGGKKESGQMRFGGRNRPHKKPFMFPDRHREDRDADSDSSRTRRDNYGRSRYDNADRGDDSYNRSYRREDDDFGRRERSDRDGGRRDRR